MLKIYNSLTKKKEHFIPLNENYVNIYVCGPTVYDHLHIGNIRPLVFFHMLKCYLTFLGFKVRLVINITDIDDKIIDKAISQQKTEQYIAKHYTKAFFSLLEKLNIDKIDELPCVTNYIDDIVSYIDKLNQKGYTYQTKEGIYFRVSYLNNYGILSNQDLTKLKKNKRKQIVQYKENFEDFVLWKKTTKGIQYNSPWFKGRPGWHTECVVMIKKIFKNNTIDIHGGGNDLKFPHHENEQAQFWVVENKPLTNFFMHIGHVYYKDAKMSKSLGNIVLAKDILKNIEPNAIKLFFLSCNYSQPINYSYELLKKFQLKYQQMIYHLNKNNFQLVLYQIHNSQIIFSYVEKIHLIMSDNFNTANILTLIEELLKKIHHKYDLLDELALFQNTLIYLLNHLGFSIVLNEVTTEKIKLYYLWKEAQNKKDFKKSDALRIILQKENIL